MTAVDDLRIEIEVLIDEHPGLGRLMRPEDAEWIVEHLVPLRIRSQDHALWTAARIGQALGEHLDKHPGVRTARLLAAASEAAERPLPTDLTFRDKREELMSWQEAKVIRLLTIRVRNLRPSWSGKAVETGLGLVVELLRRRWREEEEEPVTIASSAIPPGPK